MPTYGTVHVSLNKKKLNFKPESDNTDVLSFFFSWQNLYFFAFSTLPTIVLSYVNSLFAKFVLCLVTEAENYQTLNLLSVPGCNTYFK